MMNRNAVRLVLILGIFSIIGIIAVQAYFIQKAFRQEDRELDRALQIALRSAAQNLARYNGIDPPRENPVIRKGSSYYIVNTHSEIDPHILEQFLISEFKSRGIDLDFEYAIYDCRSDRMEYGRLVRFAEESKIHSLAEEWPKQADLTYYFGINFPGRNHVLLNSLSIWYFFSFILVLVIVFFGYSQWIILRQRRYTEIQRDFINTMTHEFKTPLASLQMSADVLQNPKIIQEPDRLHRYSEIIRSQVGHLLKQVDQVLESGGVDEKRVQLDLQKVDLKNLINETLNQLSSIFQSARATVTTDLPDQEVIIKADPLHLTNVLFNLIDNSLKYSDGEPFIHLSVSVINGYALLAVADRGPGIPPASRKRIFDRFYRVPTGNVHNVKGFGLGLYYVKRVARSHGWRVAIENNEDQGTRVVLKIPAK
ncbi:MAG: HAMP domain-containing histidine kinase [Bacteroidales bacterium]|nr:HAMP domain-containing histidine kinase [Bacteroidales bacterium]